jgi:hypothetical protein
MDRRDQVGLLSENGDQCGFSGHGLPRPPAALSMPSSRSASSRPPCRSPIVFILLRSTPIVTRVWAIFGDSR